MEMNQAYLIDAGWIFFAGWSLVLLAITLVAFGRDLLSFTKGNGNAKREPQR